MAPPGPLWAPFDVALWDLWAKLQGLPLCLEGSAGIDPQTAANEAKKAEVDGYRAYALTGTTSVIDVGVPRAQTDAALAAIGAAREAVAPGFPLLYAGALPPSISQDRQQTWCGLRSPPPAASPMC